MARTQKQDSGNKTGAEKKFYTNSDGEHKEFIWAWHNSSWAKGTMKAYPMTPEGAKRLAKEKGYDSSYSHITSKGNQRYFYELELRKAGEIEITRKKGVASLNNRGQLVIKSVNMVANIKKSSFTTL